jgi:Tol biopolymer transport system component
MKTYECLRNPDYSPDGTRLVFASTRSGAEELWISDVDGSNSRQMIFMNGPQCSNRNGHPIGTRSSSTRTGNGRLTCTSSSRHR